MKRKKISILVAAVLAAALLVSGCGSGSTTTSAGAEDQETAEKVLKDTLVVAVKNDIASMDPVTNQYTEDISALASVTEPLVKLTEDGKFEACLAEDWETSEDELTWKFKLKEGLLFSDGSKVTMEDWIFTFNRAIEHTESIFYTYVQSIESVEAEGESTLVFHLKNADPAFLTNMTSCNTKLQSKARYDAVGEEAYATEGPIGTGPYVFSEWIPGESLLFEKNPNYRDADSVAMNHVQLKVVSDAETRSLMLQSGEVDVICDVDFNSIETLDAMDGITATGFSSGIIKYICINHRWEPFDDVKVRKALSLAIDYQQIVDLVLAGKGKVATSYIPSVANYFDESIQPETNIDEAKKLLSEAGYPDGFEFEFIVQSGNAIHEQAATILKQQWEQIGVTANLKIVENAVARELFATNGMAMYLSQWTLQNNDPASLSDYFWVYDQSECWMAGYKNETASALNEEAKKETDDAKRAEDYKELQKIFADDVIHIPLMQLPFAVAYNDNVEDFYETPYGTFDFTNVKCYEG